MADLSITPANVSGSDERIIGVAGGTITAGLTVRLNATNEVIAAGNDSAANAAAIGIALNGASDGQPVAYQKSGSIDLGATLAVGKVYVLSASGAISPVDDVATSDYVTVLGVATAADALKLGIVVSGVQAAGDVT